MGVKFGEIDSTQILENEYRINVLERVVDHLLTANPSTGDDLNIDEIRKNVIKDLQVKYPNSGIDLKG